MKIYVTDTETTDLSDDRGVVEVAWVELLYNEEFNEYYLGESESFLVNPEKTISQEAAAIHGIRNSDITPDLPTLAEVPLPQEPCIFVAHNAEFDLHTLRPYMNVEASLCTLQLSRRLISGSESHQLGTLAAHCNLSRQLSHRASGDIINCAELLMWVLSRNNMTVESAIDFLAKPWVFNKMPFGKHKGKNFSDVPSGYLHWLSEQDLDADTRTTLDYWRKM